MPRYNEMGDTPHCSLKNPTSKDISQLMQQFSKPEHPVTREAKDKEVVQAGGTQFSTGAVRSNDKAGVRYDLISPIGLRRIAETYKEGYDKYGPFNWERGMPISDILNHAIAHIYTFLSGVESGEDDLAHATWNLLAAMHMEETHPNLDHELRKGVITNEEEPVNPHNDQTTSKP